MSSIQKGEPLNEGHFVLSNLEGKEIVENVEDVEQQSVSEPNKENKILSEEKMAQIVRNRELALQKLADRKKELEKEKEKQQEELLNDLFGEESNVIESVEATEPEFRDSNAMQTEQFDENPVFIDEEDVNS